MYKLIIVDDEKVIRRGLVDLIPWAELGFSVEADFEDGREAIEYLRRNDVHAVLTDVRMNEISGLELAKWVHSHSPHIKVIIISGYKEFDYARQAIQYNVSHYMLKPTKLEEIESVFVQVKQELAKEERELMEQRRSKEWLPLLSEQFFTDLLMGALRSSKELIKRLESIGFPFAADDGCCVATIHIVGHDGAEAPSSDDHDRMIAGLSRLLKQQVESGVAFYPVPTREPGFKVVGIWTTRFDLASGKRLAEEGLNQLIASARAVFAIDIAARVEHVYGSLIELAGHSEKVRLTYQESAGKLRLEEHEYTRLITKYKLFFSNVLEGNIEEASSLMDRFLEEFREVPASYSHRMLRDLFSIIQHTLSQSGVDVGQLTGKVLNYDMAEGEIDEMWSLGKDTVTEVIHTMASTKADSSRRLIEQAKQFIGEHYQRDISLDNVADSVFLHPVYFSKLFKQHAGINFSEYLTKLRIERAKTLIQTNQYRMYEVGSMVGYPNSKYFYRVFKQATGHTPTEYAELANGENRPI